MLVILMLAAGLLAPACDSGKLKIAKKGEWYKVQDIQGAPFLDIRFPSVTYETSGGYHHLTVQVEWVNTWRAMQTLGGDEWPVQDPEGRIFGVEHRSMTIQQIQPMEKKYIDFYYQIPEAVNVRELNWGLCDRDTKVMMFVIPIKPVEVSGY